MAARQSTERRNILHQVTQDIVSVSLDPEAFYAGIHRAATRLMPAEAFVITCLTDDPNLVEAVYLSDRSGRVPNRTIPANAGLTGQILSSGKSQNIRNLAKDSPSLPNPPHFGDPAEVASVLAVPMRLRGATVGMVSAQSYRPNAYTDDDTYLLEMLANYAAIALENHRLFQQLQKLAITDPMINANNRRHLFELGEREMLRARRFGRPLAVLMLDIDHFKQINDQYGHATGDKVLRRLGEILLNRVREIDVVGRYGGEELVVVLPEADIASAHEVAERLRAEIEATFKQGILPAVTVSIGVASLQADIPDFETLVHRADVAMYAAKQAGRNRVRIAQVNHAMDQKPPDQ
jgi:diguanylate cyclase (GGDEF)-like protein